MLTLTILALMLLQQPDHPSPFILNLTLRELR